MGRTVAGSVNSFLCTTREFGDFVLETDVWIAPGSNSGIQIRSHVDDSNRYVYGYQIEIQSATRAGA